MNKKMYLVGKVTDYDNNSWEFSGVFGDEKLAIENCFNQNYFLAEIFLDEKVPKESHQFNYSYYPKLEAKPTRN